MVLIQTLVYSDPCTFPSYSLELRKLFGTTTETLGLGRYENSY